MTSSDQEQCVTHCHNVIQCHTHHVQCPLSRPSQSICMQIFQILTFFISPAPPPPYNFHTQTLLASPGRHNKQVKIVSLDSQHLANVGNEIMATLTVSMPVCQYPQELLISDFKHLCHNLQHSYLIICSRT